MGLRREREKRKGGGRGKGEVVGGKREERRFKNTGDLISGKVLRYHLVFRSDWKEAFL